MKVAILGSGNMGSAFARRLSASGHDVTIASKKPEHAQEVAGKVSARAVPLANLAQDADIIIAATPYEQQVNGLRSVGKVSGKTVIEISNPLKPDYSGLVVGHTTSAAEEIAKALPGTKVIKAFNTIFAQVLNDGADFGGSRRAAVFYAGDDEAAKESVRALIESMNFEATDAGPLHNARYLEPMGMLNIWFGYMAKRGTDIAPAWLSRS
ncbi:MAG TPA: NADPH-dependent F420 reductase [Nitrospiraceae bacterium]|nr:NADPH-dependent F420 reductase [Nitrospiraceae bacterium]